MRHLVAIALLPVTAPISVALLVHAALVLRKEARDPNSNFFQ